MAKVRKQFVVTVEYEEQIDALGKVTPQALATGLRLSLNRAISNIGEVVGFEPHKAPEGTVVNTRSGEDVAKALSSFLNCCGNREEQKMFVERVLRDHRTLQQSTMGLFLQCIRGWAENAKGSYHDARNEATVKLAAKIMETTTERDRALPFI